MENNKPIEGEHIPKDEYEKRTGKFRKFAAWALDPKDLVRPVISQAKETGGRLGEIIDFLNPFKDRTSKQNETFGAAVFRLNLSEVDIRNSYFSYVRMTYLTLFFFVAFVAYSWICFSKGSMIAGFETLALSLVHLAYFHRNGFRAYQIKSRKLCSVKEHFESRKFFPSFTF